MHVCTVRLCSCLALVYVLQDMPNNLGVIAGSNNMIFGGGDTIWFAFGSLDHVFQTVAMFWRVTVICIPSLLTSLCEL